MRPAPYIAPTLCLIAAGFAAWMSYSNEFRAAHGCAPYNSPFVHEHAVKLALEMAIPFVAMAFGSYLALSFMRHWAPDVLTVFACASLLALAGCAAVESHLSAYAPCGQNGDSTSFAVFLFAILVVAIWFFITLPLVIIAAAQRLRAESQTE